MNAGSERHDTDATTTDGDPVYRKNPHPTEAYRITMTIEDAPGGNPPTSSGRQKWS